MKIEVTDEMRQEAELFTMHESRVGASISAEERDYWRRGRDMSARIIARIVARAVREAEKP